MTVTKLVSSACATRFPSTRRPAGFLAVELLPALPVRRVRVVGSILPFPLRGAHRAVGVVRCSLSKHNIGEHDDAVRQVAEALRGNTTLLELEYVAAGTPPSPPK